MKKRLIIIFLLFLSISVHSTTVHADDEEGNELDLDTENINNQNDESLTDKNEIPLFSIDYKKNEMESYKQDYLFSENFSGIVVDQTMSIFQEKVIITQKNNIEVTNNGNDLLIIGSVMSVLLILVTIFLTRYFQNKKSEKRGVTYDYNF